MLKLLFRIVLNNRSVNRISGSFLPMKVTICNQGGDYSKWAKQKQPNYNKKTLFLPTPPHEVLLRFFSGDAFNLRNPLAWVTTDSL